MIRRYTAPVGIAAAVVAADLVTKRLASIRFQETSVDVIPGFLVFTYTENPGSAFSLFQDAGPVLGVAAIVVIGVILWLLHKGRPTAEMVALALVLGGAGGNLADRIFRGDGFLDGSVIDWISLWWIPTFNVADASITIAVGLLLIESWRRKK